MPRGPAEQHKEEVVRAYFQRVTQGEVEGILELFHDNAIVIHPLTESGIKGKAALRAFYQNLTANLVDYSARPTDIVIEGDKVVAPLHLEGKTKDGQPITMNNLNFYTFAGEKIQSLRIYMDTHPYRAALSGTLRNE
jgi:ketosteroid isomerase-like protein